METNIKKGIKMELMSTINGFDMMALTIGFIVGYLTKNNEVKK